MRLAFLYAGQGSQTPGMGKDFYESFPLARESFENKSAGFDLRELCFAAPPETLAQTRYTQPCLAAFAAAVTKLLYARGIRPDYAAGLSLGEYSALYAAGALDEDTLLSLVAFRGRVMEETTRGMHAKMCAVFGLSEEALQAAVEEAGAAGLGTVACANFNCPGQIVIGGEAAAVDRAVERCRALGAKRCLPLNVSGPFHTPLLEEASRLLGERLKTVSFSALRLPVVFNVTAEPLARGQTIPRLLEEQVKRPVLFERSIRRLRDMGVDTAVEIGPGRVLSGFVRKTAPEIDVYSIEDTESFSQTVKALRHRRAAEAVKTA